jgi:hypothetical protein
MKESTLDGFGMLKRSVSPLINWALAMSPYGKNSYTTLTSIVNVSVCDFQKNPGLAYFIKAVSLSQYIHDCPYTVSFVATQRM